MSLQPKVAISIDFLWAFAQIPRQLQGKVREFIEKFKRNPLAPGVNYEVIRNARDPRLRSVRINDAYRGIVLKPDRGDVYALLWVDHHDEAYAWAQNRRVDVHPETGALQVMEIELQEAHEPRSATPNEPALFASYRDRELTRLGIPEDLLPRIRAMRAEGDLEAARPALPDEAYEALFLLMAGYTPEQIERDRSRLAEDEGTPQPPENIDREDFVAALDRPDSKRRFLVVEDDLELAAILNAPLERWRVFLHPSQRTLVEARMNGPIRVLGGAGTGKTVVAMHRAKWLVEHALKHPGDRVLFTTYTVNLAEDIRANLAAICPPETLARIEVTPLDAWVRRFLERQGFKRVMTYDEPKRTKEAWDRAMALVPASSSLAEAFYREEFDQIVLAQGLTSQAEYLKAPRTGRGTSLSTRQRAEVWPLFEAYRRDLADQVLIEPADAMREARHLLESQGDVLPYFSIVVDEAQDLGAQAWKLLRAIIPQQRQYDLFLVGDAHQRIYGTPIKLGSCGINIRGNRSRTLRINYRTTDEIRRWAVALLEGKAIDDLDGERDTAEGYRSLMHGDRPNHLHFDRAEDELAYLANRMKQFLDEQGSLRDHCLVARTRQQRDAYARELTMRGIPVHVLEQRADDPSVAGLRLATAHRVKGLEFNTVWIAGANDGIYPLIPAMKATADEASRDEAELRDRSLLYVAATRAKREVTVTSYGKVSAFLS